MSPLLEVRDLVKRFPISGSRSSVQAVNGVSFSLAQGETLGLVGESGSGKTTIGRMILGLTDVTAGQILFQGRELASHRRSARRAPGGQIQIVFQEPGEALDPRIRIGRSIEEPLTALKIGPADRQRRAAEALDFVGLPRGMLRLYPSELSGGQQQRVSIARAMVTRPKLLVLDEPTSALDPSARAAIVALLKQIQAEFGTSLLFISHDLSTVRFISHRVAVLYLGMLVEEGGAAAVFAAPRHPYSVGLLSSVLLPNPRLKPGSSVSLAGEIPSPINLPAGCFLASRCPFVQDRCRAAIPAPEQLGGGHMVRCIRHASVAQLDRTNDTFEQFQQEAERILSVGAPGFGSRKEVQNGKA